MNKSISGCGFLYTVLKPEMDFEIWRFPIKFLAKKGHFLSFERENEISPLFPPWKFFYATTGKTTIAHLEKSFRRPCACTPIPASHTTVQDLRCILSLNKYRITGIQSYKIVFVSRACNIQCILHQSCPRKTRNFTPMTNPVISRITLWSIVGPSAKNTWRTCEKSQTHDE